MKRLKEIRQSRGLTQADLAKALGTTQQTVGRWEAGKATPSISMLNALARALSTRVDVLAADAFTPADVEDEESSWFWGHIGLLLPTADKTVWYPISAATRSRVWGILRNLDSGDDESDWLVVDTMNNRVLAFIPDRLDRVWLLDDGCDGPDGDWEPKFVLGEYAGLSSEEYAAFDRWMSSAWEDGDEGIAKDLEAKLKEHNLDDPDKLYKHLHYSHVHYSSGRVTSHHVEPSDLWSAISDLELGFNRCIYLPGYSQADEIFVPLKNVCLVDVPLIDLQEGRLREEQSLAEVELPKL